MVRRRTAALVMYDINMMIALGAARKTPESLARTFVFVWVRANV